MLRLRLLRQVRPAVAVLYRSLLARRLRVAVAVCRSQVARRLVATVVLSPLVSVQVIQLQVAQSEWLLVKVPLEVAARSV